MFSCALLLLSNKRLPVCRKSFGLQPISCLSGFLIVSVKETFENATLNVGQRDLGEILISIYVLSIVINTQTTEMGVNLKKMF